MKKLILIIPMVLLVAACSTPRTVLKTSNGQVAVCGGDMSSSVAAGFVGYYLQKKVDSECVETYAKNGFKITEKED